MSNSAKAGQRVRGAGGRARLMAHMIPAYPDLESSYNAFCGIVDGGAEFLEIQFPFSDPTADGPVIEAACTKALANGFSVDRGFEFVRRVADYIAGAGAASGAASGAGAVSGAGASGAASGASADGLAASGSHAAAGSGSPRICIMSYANLVYVRGVEKFCRDAAAAGVWGLVIPDLPFDSDEGLLAAAKSAGLEVVPVLVPTNTRARIEMVLAHKPKVIYAALRTGITGTRTELGPKNLEFLATLTELAKQFGGEVYGGFGIQEKDQIRALEEQVDGVIVGTALVKQVTKLVEAGTSGSALRDEMAALVSSLVLP